MNLKEIGWEGVNWIHLAQDRDQLWAVLKMLLNLQVSKAVGNLLIS
jgi:hypothetical protein